MDNLKNIGRIVYAIPFAIFGMMHFVAAKDMIGMVPGWVPGGVLWVYLTGIALLAAAIAIIIKKHVHLAAILLAVLLVVFILTIHIPGAMSGSNPMAMPSMMKDIALIGGALLIAGLYKDD